MSVKSRLVKKTEAWSGGRTCDEDDFSPGVSRVLYQIQLDTAAPPPPPRQGQDNVAAWAIALFSIKSCDSLPAFQPGSDVQTPF